MSDTTIGVSFEVRDHLRAMKDDDQTYDDLLRVELGMPPVESGREEPVDWGSVDE